MNQVSLFYFILLIKNFVNILDLNFTEYCRMEPNQQKVQVHVRSDSKDSLDALFQQAHARTSSGKPFRDRNLPDSFFNPPSKQPAHTRSQSLPILDHGNKFSFQPQMNSPGNGNRSGADSANGTASNNQNNMRQTPGHQRGHSTGNVLESPPLPPGWEAKTTAQGQKYFIKYVLLNFFQTLAT